MAVIIGVACILLPREMIIVGAITLIAWVISRHEDLAIGIGAVSLFVLTWVDEQNPLLMLYLLVLVPTIGIKKMMDLPRDHRLTGIDRRGNKH